MDIYSKLGLEELGIDKNNFRDKARTSISLGMNLEGNAAKFLCDRFIEEENREYFVKQFQQAISGDGNELLKMDAVKSSSLCSLLFFYNLNKSKEHQLEINGVKYTKSFFEYKNKVYRNPSNMDVVLTNDEGDILFVECKFSEYLEADKPEISSSYFTNEESKDVMNSLLNERMLIKRGEKRYSAVFNSKPVYATGLKQIVAHYIGINHFIARELYENNYGDDRDMIKHISNPRVRFIEVLFDFGEGLKDYRKASDYLINEIIKKPDIYKPSITYQEILNQNKDYKLDKNVLKFYKNFA